MRRAIVEINKTFNKICREIYECRLFCFVKTLHGLMNTKMGVIGPLQDHKGSSKSVFVIRLLSTFVIYIRTIPIGHIN